MTNSYILELARLRAAVRANGDDAYLWRWYSDMMEDHRLVCKCLRGIWSVEIDGRPMAENASFDLVLRSAQVLFKARTALNLV